MSTYEAGNWRSISAQNFRKFENTGPVELRPITLLFGKNSSGKTSLLRLPLLLKQIILESAPGEVPLAGRLVDFGLYRDLVLRGEIGRDVKIGFFLDYRRSRYGALRRRKQLPVEFHQLFEAAWFEISLHWNVRDSYTQIQRISVAPSRDEPPLITLERSSPSQFYVSFAERPRLLVHETLSFATLRFFNLARSVKTPLNESDEDFDWLLFIIFNNLVELSGEIIHIGPLRDMPARAYGTQAGGQAESAGRVVEMLDRAADARARVSRALDYMDMAGSVDLDKPAPGYVGIMLLDTETGRSENLADVGFGVSQVLPILATLATCPENSTVLIEQPELHLHPAAQGQFADVLFDFSRERGLTLMMETHSEHILLRLQRRIAEESVSPDDAAVYFVDRGQVNLAEIDQYGKLDTSALPTGFFDESWEDAQRLSAAAAQRRSRDD